MESIWQVRPSEMYIKHLAQREREEPEGNANSECFAPRSGVERLMVQVLTGR